MGKSTTETEKKNEREKTSERGCWFWPMLSEGLHVDKVAKVKINIGQQMGGFRFVGFKLAMLIADNKAVGKHFLVGLFCSKRLQSVDLTEQLMATMRIPSKKSITVVGKYSYCPLLQWLQRGHNSVWPLYMTTQ